MKARDAELADGRDYDIAIYKEMRGEKLEAEAIESLAAIIGYTVEGWVADEHKANAKAKADKAAKKKAARKRATSGGSADLKAGQRVTGWFTHAVAF